MQGVLTEEEQFNTLLLKNTANYGPYSDLIANDGVMTVNCRNINDMNIDDHLKWIHNILLDGIDGALFQTGYLRLGNAHLGGDLHLRFSFVKPQ